MPGGVIGGPGCSPRSGLCSRCSPKIREMGARYLFIVAYCLIEHTLSRGDYRAATRLCKELHAARPLGRQTPGLISAVGAAMSG